MLNCCFSSLFPFQRRNPVRTLQPYFSRECRVVIPELMTPCPLTSDMLQQQRELVRRLRYVFVPWSSISNRYKLVWRFLGHLWGKFISSSWISEVHGVSLVLHRELRSAIARPF